jgi:hypothetical protein
MAPITRTIIIDIVAESLCRILRGQQVGGQLPECLGFPGDATIALQDGHVADGIRDMREHAVVVLLDRGLTFLGLSHHVAADRDVAGAEAQEDTRHAHVECHGGRDQQQQRDGGREMLAHELQPQAEERLDRAQQRMQRIRGVALLMPGERHRDDLLVSIGQHGASALMRQAVRTARDEHEGDDVECAQRRPGNQGRRDLGFACDGIDDAAEEDRLGDRGERQYDISTADDGNAESVSTQI